jgi:hypothetical protein
VGFNIGMRCCSLLALLACIAFLAVSSPALGAVQGPLVVQPTTAAQPTSATLEASLLPDRLDGRGSLTVTLRYGGGEDGVPMPVHRSVLRLPAGLSLDIPTLRSCSAARLRTRGPGACPAQSLLGRGYALMEVHAGSQKITEHVSMWAFLGPLSAQNLEPTFEIFGQGYTPVDESKVLIGTVTTDSSPYGEQLVLAIPPIPSLPLEPDTSIATFSLTIGTSGHGSLRTGAQVLVPHSCPPGGFPFAGEFEYADGSTGSASATVPCP